jgi:hypothetical protein
VAMATNQVDFGITEDDIKEAARNYGFLKEN